MEQECACCPVCTLYLREGITLQAHLETHPKDKVIEALLKVANPNSAPLISQSGEEPLHGQPCVAPNSGFVTQTSNQGNSQPQASAAAASYQHIASSSASTVIPPYIQVVTPNSSTSLTPNQTITFMPHPHPSPYVPPIYNPIYNPYIPQPYPVVQPVYTNMPFSADINPLMSTSQVTSPVTAPSTGQNAASGRSETVLKQFSNAATNTGPDALLVRRKSKILQLRSRFGARVTPRLRSISQTKLRMRKQLALRKKATASTSAASTSAISAAGSQGATDVSDATNTDANTSVIAKAKSFKSKNKPISPKPSTSSSASVITQLPVTPGPTLRSRSSSESSSSPGHSPCPMTSVPFVSPEDGTEEIHIGSEDSNSKPDVVGQDNQNVSNVSEYSGNCERGVSSCTVITDRTRSVQLTDDTFMDNCNTYENINEPDSENESTSPQLPFHVEDSAVVHDQQPEMSGNVCKHFERDVFINEEDRLSDYDEEIPDKMFRSFEIEQENKVAFAFDLGNQEANEEENNANRDEMFCGSDDYTAEGSLPSGMRIVEEEEEEANEPEFIDNATPGGTEGDNTTLGVKKVSSVIFLGNGSVSNAVTPSIERAPQAEEEVDFSDLKCITYTDLQPATNNSVLENLEMAASLNLNNYMEVDGVKIFFSTGNVQNMPLEPVIQFSSPNTDVPKLENYVKPENEKETLVESVIHLVSGTTPKGDFSGETFQGSTSENNAEVRDLSPLSLSIRADESMPARGELSEQESLGGDNSTWTFFHSEVRTKSEQNLMSGNEFRATILDVEDCEVEGKSDKCSYWGEGIPPLKLEDVNDGTESDKSKQPIPRKPKMFSCPECKEQFGSLRARKNHVIEKHFYDPGKDQEDTADSETRNENEANSKEDLADSASESATESARGENLEGDEAAGKRESSAKKPKDKSACEVTRLCPTCNLPFVGLKKLKEHLREVHGESKYKCGTCSEIFETEKEYNAHLRIHPLKCNQCGKLFYRKPNLKLHMKRHLSIKPYTCNQCPKSFITRQKLEEHTNGHTGHKPLKCTSCDRSFSRHSNLIQHRNIHHFCGKRKVKDFVCRCGEVFHSARKLAWHKEVHDTKPKTCSFCSQKFIHTNSVTRHIRRSHMPNYLPKDKKDAENIQCPVCGKIYLRSSLAVHMRVHNGEKPFICKICSKSFTTKWNLELHNWTHQSRSSMPFKCTSCKSAFYREVDYNAHMNSHKNLRPFTCNTCGQKFIRKYNCLRHQEEHKKEKKFVCTVSGCEKSFHRSYYLRDHMRIHTGVRPHTCHICGKASSTKSNHNKHIRIHDTREPLNSEN